MPSHRAPREPIADKSRYAMAAALVAGVGVTGLAVADGAGSPAGAAPRVQSLPLTSASGSPYLTSAIAASGGTLGATSPGGVAATGLLGTGNAAMISGSGTGSTAGTATSSAGRAGVIAPSSGVAGVVPIGGIELGDDFVPQQLKERPRPEWVNPLPAGSVTSCFGERWGRLHAGVDIAAPSGTPIVSAGAGIVVAAGAEQGYGNAVLVDHGNGYLTHYGHMSAITAKVGQHVAAGDQIGNEGSTGHSTGPHLHFEVHQGTYKNPVEPTAWMHAHGVDIPGCAAS